MRYPGGSPRTAGRAPRGSDTNLWHFEDAVQTGSWMPRQSVKARFIEPMLLQYAEKLSSCQLKLDGFRAVPFKTAGCVHLRFAQ
jgi:hypothetical protein